MQVELSDIDIIFIYGHFIKELSKIDKVALSPNCPYDKSTIENQKEPYLSVVKKLSSQFPNLTKMDNSF